MKDKIDVVIPWVDNTDLNWISTKEKYEKKYLLDKKSNGNNRYQNWENLHYLLRGIEKYMSWVNKIFIITANQCPTFINDSHPKLRIINHSEYIPKKYLPTFNSNVIELNYHRIKELSEQFILFNDDCFPIAEQKLEDYFIDGIPCDEGIESPIVPTDIGNISNYASYVKANNILIINQHFNKREVQSRDWDKWCHPCYGELLKRNQGLNYWNHFVGFHDYHLPFSLLKSTLSEVWKLENEKLDEVCQNKFRNYNDLSCSLIRYWQLCKGDFIPKKVKGKTFLISGENYCKIVQEIEKYNGPMICLTEDCTSDEFVIIKQEINRVLETKLPEKSSFER